MTTPTVPLPDKAFCFLCKNDLPLSAFPQTDQFFKLARRQTKGIKSEIRCLTCRPNQGKKKKSSTFSESGDRVQLSKKVRRKLKRHDPYTPTLPPTLIQRKVQTAKSLPYEERRAIYQKYLASEAWLRTRVRVYNARGAKCEKCSSELNLDVHHLTYDRVGFELDSDLQILCGNCHRMAHRRNVFGARIQWK